MFGFMWLTWVAGFAAVFIEIWLKTWRSWSM
jgi:hypothetical protein